ncbi:hypothetical protein CR969_01730 [Candidatus Saccharibacteria bacterium]|nr:MAG: hypothetical protein CR969_01730 [Candidatus Saccharibacteria bacterium]
MTNPEMILSHDINGEVHIVNKSELIKRVSVYGVIENDNGILLVSDRSRSDGRWDFPGGGIEAGESTPEALSREIKEETGLDIVGEPEEICWFTEYFYDIDTDTAYESSRGFYRASAVGQLTTEGNSQDVTAAAYFKSPIPDNKTTPVVRQILKLYLAH